MKKYLRIFGSLIKWGAIIVVSIELLSFSIITASNFVLYGHAREGSRAKYDPYTLFLMAEGLRPTAYNSSSSDSKYNKKIWLFGGSTLRGDSGSYENTIPSFISKFLNSDEGPLNFTVTNFGVNSFNSLLEAKYLQKMLIETHEPPDLIVFYDGANEAAYAAQYRTPYGHYGYRRTRALIESYFRSWFGLFKPLNAALYSSFTLELYDKLHEVYFPIDPNSSLLKEIAEMTEKRYDHVQRISHAYGADFLLIWQPMLWVEDCKAPKKIKGQEKTFIMSPERFQTVRHNFSTVYQTLAEKLRNKSYYMSFQNVLCGATEAYGPDGVHLTDEGRKTVAEKMSVVLREKFFKN